MMGGARCLDGLWLDGLRPGDNPGADLRREPIDYIDHEYNQYDDRPCLIPAIGSDAVGKQEAYSACTHNAQNGARAHIAFKVVERDGHDHRQSLRHGAKMDGLEPGATRCHDTLDRFLRRVLDCLGVEFAKNTNLANRDSQHTRQRTEPEGTNEDKRKNK